MSNREPEYAFPFECNFTQYTGMTLRDYFAAKAMQGIMANVEWDKDTPIAASAYRVADAMLKVRAQ